MVSLNYQASMGCYKNIPNSGMQTTGKYIFQFQVKINVINAENLIMINNKIILVLTVNVCRKR